VIAEHDSRCMGCMEVVSGDVCPHCGWEEGTPPVSPLFLLPRTILDGKYLVGKALGAGGFGITYLAWDQDLALKLAIKEYFPNALGTRDVDHCTVVATNTQSKAAFSQGLAKFLEEGRALARFQGHPCIASVLTFFRGNGTSYLVMKFEEGITFQRYLEEHGGRIDFDQAMRIVGPVMDALRAVHTAGILHRDISPDNIIINRSKQVKILDFGSAKRDMASQDQSFQITLKRGYSPEEQYRGSGQQGPWTDIYALGATVYRAITGKKPPDSLDRMQRDTLEAPSRLGVQIPKRCEKALMKALAVRSTDRFQTIEQFQEAMAAGPKPIDPVEKPGGFDLRAWLGRHRRAVILTSAAVVLLVVIVGLLRVLLSVPVIRQFTIDPSTIGAGQRATLRWSVTGGRIAIAPAIGRVDQAGTRQVSPRATTTYALTARGWLRSVSKSVTLAVPANAPAITFTVEPPTINRGESTELAWSVERNPTRVTITPDIGVVAARDHRTVSPTADTVYKLTAEGPNGPLAEASVSITIASGPRPVIISFKAEPSTIERKKTARLSWIITGDDTTATINQGIGNVKLNDSIEVQPASTTKYTLCARNSAGPIYKYVTVVVQEIPPHISQFGVAPPKITRGQSATLTWSVAGDVDSVEIEPEIGTVNAQDERKVFPTSTTSYVLIAKGPRGTDTQTASVQVAAPLIPPEITEFAASPSTIASGQQATLRWSVRGSLDAVTIQPELGSVEPGGSSIVTPRKSTDYILIARGPAGTVSKHAEVQVSQEQFSIAYFTATPQKVKRGHPAHLAWSVTGPIIAMAISPDIGSLQPDKKSGARDVKPEKDTTYILSVQAGGQTLERSVTIKVSK